jgi:hypothetical protein
LKGVVEGVAGLEATGAIVTAVGAVTPKFSFKAGNDVVAGMTAVVTPAGIVATFELGVEPELIVARAGKLTLYTYVGAPPLLLLPKYKSKLLEKRIAFQLSNMSPVCNFAWFVISQLDEIFVNVLP